VGFYRIPGDAQHISNLRVVVPIHYHTDNFFFSTRQRLKQFKVPDNHLILFYDTAQFPVADTQLFRAHANNQSTVTFLVVDKVTA